MGLYLNIIKQIILVSKLLNKSSPGSSNLSAKLLVMPDKSTGGCRNGSTALGFSTCLSDK